MWRIFLMAFLAGAAAWPMAATARPGGETAETRRIALVIGNGGYGDRPLASPANDARAMGATLRSLGFEVLERENASRQEMLAAIREYSRRLAPGGVGFFYYAGHGLRVGNRTLLLPVEADARLPARLLAAGIDLENVLAAMAAPRPGKANLVVLDTCLDNPFGTGAGAVSGLPAQTLVAYAAAPGAKAAEVDRHGVYTAALLNALAAPGREAAEVFEAAGAEVLRVSGGAQTPVLQSTLPSGFRFRATGPAPLPPQRLAAAVGDTRTRGVLPKDSAEQYELTFWESIKDSTYPGDYEAYLQTYPKGRFASLAKARLERLRAAAAKSEAPPAAKPAPEKAPPPRAAPERPRPAPPTAAKAAPEPATPAPAPAPAPRKAAADTAGVGEVRDCPTCPVLVTLPRGSFTMGSNIDDPSERPPHPVSIGESFAIGKYEVTAEQWSACVAAGGCPHIATNTGVPGNSPARDVSWNDAQLYVKWLGKVSGKAYRLPTEAEWEYAARGGSGSRYWWGDQMRPGNAACKGCGEPWQQEAPAKVGSFTANPWGLHDVNGSVWEWVADCWHSSYRGAPPDGKAWNEPNCLVRVIRGGSWADGPAYMPVSTRFKYDASVRESRNGFRVVRDNK